MVHGTPLSPPAPLLQHNVSLGMTTGAGGDIRVKMTKLLRACNLKRRGTRGKVNALLAGEEFIDAYTSYMEANGLRYNSDASTPSGADIGIPDSDVAFENVRIVHDPTFEDIDASGYGDNGVPWTKRCYFLNTDTWNLFHPKSKNKYLSYPLDEYDRRATRQSIDGRHALTLNKPTNNGLASIA